MDYLTYERNYSAIHGLNPSKPDKTMYGRSRIIHLVIYIAKNKDILFIYK